MLLGYIVDVDSQGQPETLRKGSGMDHRTLLLQLQRGHGQEWLSLGVCGRFTPFLGLFSPSQAIEARSTPQTTVAQWPRLLPPLH